MRHRNATTTTELKNANDQCTTLRTCLGDTQKVLSDTQKVLSDTQKVVTGTQDKTLDLRKQLRDAQAANAILQTERDDARQASAKAEQHALDNEAKWRAENQELQTELQAANDNRFEVDVKLDKRITALATDKDQLTHQVRKYQNDFTALQAKYETAINQNRVLQNQRRGLQNQNRELRSTVEQTKIGPA
jgi:chromosome segregation ATPase